MYKISIEIEIQCISFLLQFLIQKKSISLTYFENFDYEFMNK